jgi:endogenous inhibitor of DNA gyrase (YacG/DUF329 family)
VRLDKYCSDACRLAYRRRRQLHTQCEQCGSPIILTGWQQRNCKHHFCSQRCNFDFPRRASRTSLNCVICGTLVERSKSVFARHLSVFCSSRCHSIAMGAQYLRDPYQELQFIDKFVEETSRLPLRFILICRHFLRHRPTDRCQSLCTKIITTYTENRHGRKEQAGTNRRSAIRR